MPLTRLCMADPTLPMFQLLLYLSLPSPAILYTPLLSHSLLHLLPFSSTSIPINSHTHNNLFVTTQKTRTLHKKMCSSKAKLLSSPSVDNMSPPTVARINGRPVLQPTCNRVPSLERRNSLKKVSPKSPPPPPPPAVLPPPPSTTAKTKASLTPPISPKSKSPRPQPIKRGNDVNGLNSISTGHDKVLTPRKTVTLERKNSKKVTAAASGSIAAVSPSIESSFSYSSSLILEAPGTIAAVRREQIAFSQTQRKMRIAHYGRTKSAKFDSKIAPLESLSSHEDHEEKRCTFITSNSDPLYVAYHDEEWGVPVHDDKMLFELLVLSGAQVGSDWTSILKKRQDFRNAFSGFDAETIANFSERQIISVSADYGIELSRVRGVVDNSNRILEIKRQFGSLENYIWGFVNRKPISTQYKSSHKIPVKTSKSESISKDMVRRGFRFVGPTVVHSFMQAAGLTNDHLITCHRHLQCTALADHRPTVAPAL